MRGGKHLLLLAGELTTAANSDKVFTLLVRCQQKPQVSMSPRLRQIFTGDLFYLSCDNSTNESPVKWYLNNVEQKWTSKTLKIAVAAPTDSGSYQCESNGQKSDSLTIHVLEFVPSASLTIKTGQPVMRMGASVILKIENEDGLEGWSCWVYRGMTTNKIKLKLQKDSVTDFQTKRLTVPETIFWCTDSTQESRSNQITIRTSDKDVSLEMYPSPPIAGESLTLRCLVWNTDHISRTLFYRDNSVIGTGSKITYEISNVTNSAEGKYKCESTFTYGADTSGPPYEETSDIQDLLVQVPPIAAVLSRNMSCSCPSCPGGMSYRYYKKNGQSWRYCSSEKKPEESGTYRCRAVWNNKRTFLSSASFYVSGSHQSTVTVMLIVVAVVVIVILAAVAFLCKKRNSAGPIYEDVALRLQEQGDATYETLQMERGREGVYNTLHPEAPGREKKDDEYEALRKEGMKEGVYHTLGMEAATGGEGGYEALRKEGMKEGVYHTLGMEAATGGDGETKQKKDKDSESEIVEK